MVAAGSAEEGFFLVHRLRPDLLLLDLTLPQRNGLDILRQIRSDGLDLRVLNQLHRFTADAAHELRTPLASLRTIGEVALEKGEGSEEYREALSSILEETARLDETIGSLLLLAKAEASQSGELQTVFTASELVDEVIDLLQVVIDERNLTVIRKGETAGRIKIRAERGLLRVAFLNVLHNALKFSPECSTLGISYVRSEVSVPKLSIAFQDQGQGIAPGEHQRVFDRFFTSTSQQTASGSGTGLGLSVAKLVIDRMGGRIWFDEKIASGARCIVELPLSMVESTELERTAC